MTSQRNVVQNDEAESSPDIDSAEAMAAVFAAFQQRQVEMLADADAWAARFEEAGVDGQEVAGESLRSEREEIQRHIAAIPEARPADLWRDEWLYPVDVWSLLVGMDVPYWEAGWERHLHGHAEEGELDWSVLLRELERLRSLKVLQSNEEGKIRRDDAVKVAYTLGYSFEPGTPAYDILLHVHGVRASELARRHAPPQRGAQTSEAARYTRLVQAVVAALVYFPALGAVEAGRDGAAKLLETIREKQILPHDFFPDTDAVHQAADAIEEMLGLLNQSGNAS
jgi:hypothetical protein